MLKDLGCPCFVLAACASRQWGAEGLEGFKMKHQATPGKENLCGQPFVWPAKCGEVPKRGGRKM